MQLRKYTFFFGLVLVLGIAGGIYYYARPNNKHVVVVQQNTNVNGSFNQPNCKDLDEPWAQSVFKNGVYKNAAFGFEATIPNGWYLQTENHTQKECTPPSSTFGSTSLATFGDAGKFWRVDVAALENSENLTLSQWVQKYYRFQETSAGRKFGTVQTVYGEHTPFYISEDDYAHVAILQTGGWIEIISYHDKDSAMPRQSKFEELVASVKAYSDDQEASAALPNPDARTSVNSTTDLYTSPALGFSIHLPKNWHVRTGKDSTRDVQYSDYGRSVESTKKPLYTSDGVAPQFEEQVSTEGSAIDISRGKYYNSNFSDYLDAAFQKGSYRHKTVAIGSGIKATRVETFGYTTKYSYEYVVLHGDYSYTLSIRSANTTDEATISTMLKSFKLL
ncbi:MAG: hypothetical protein AAB445_01890 [Patescibacteria group bacterium]